MIDRQRVKTIAFDADDTLWMNETIFVNSEEEIKKILHKYVPESHAFDEKLLEFERKNLRLFGYGIKGFLLSVIETCIELSEGLVTGADIQRIIDLGKEMLEHPVHILEGVEDTVRQLDDYYRMMVITKGDLFDQENKMARSGLGELFPMVEIVSEKNTETYRALFDRNQIDPTEVLMIGNSLKSDILPVLELGAQAVHIPFATTWALEEVSPEQLEGQQYYTAENIREVLALLEVKH